MTGRGFGTGAGRPKGVANKRSREFRERVDKLSEKYGYDLIESLVVTASADIDAVASYIRERIDAGEEVVGLVVEAIAKRACDDAMEARKLLVKYGYPTLKAVELVDEDGNAVAPFRLIVDRTGTPAESAAQKTNGTTHSESEAHRIKSRPVDPLS